MADLTTKDPKEISECIKRQAQLCKEKELPHFAPSNGICWRCKRNIYQNYGTSKGKTGEEFITGCPHCSRSYCD
jgi:hypothetical protein